MRLIGTWLRLRLPLPPLHILSILFLFLLLIAGSVSADDCGNGIAPCKCGDTVVSDWTFTEDLTCPAGVAGVHGLTIGADGITIDGAGFKITGSETAEVCEWIDENNPGIGYCGIFNSGHDDVVIKNLELTGFCTGIGLQGSGKDPVVGNTIDNCEIHGNGNADCSTGTSTHGIHACYISASTIQNSRIYENTGAGEGCGDGGAGIFLYSGNKAYTGNIITKNDIYNNRKGGFFAKKSLNYAEITDNHVHGNGQGGIILRCRSSNYNLVGGNNASANFGDGIFIGSENNIIKDNVVMGNMAGFRISSGDVVGDGDGIEMGRGRESNNNTITANTVCGNAGTDIEVADGCLENHGRDNTCDTVGNYNDEGSAGCGNECFGDTATEADALVASAESTESTESTPGFGAVFMVVAAAAAICVLQSRKRI